MQAMPRRSLASDNNQGEQGMKQITKQITMAAAMALVMDEFIAWLSMQGFLTSKAKS